MISRAELQSDRMSCIKAARRPINGLPARSPFTDVMIVRRRIESQSRNDGESMALPRIDGNPFAGATLAVAAKLG